MIHNYDDYGDGCGFSCDTNKLVIASDNHHRSELLRYRKRGFYLCSGKTIFQNEKDMIMRYCTLV